MHESGDGQLASELQCVGDPPPDARGYVDWVARDAIQRVLLRMEGHERECNVYRRNAEQWQQSMDRNLDTKFQAVHDSFDSHARSDAAFQITVTSAFNDWNKWVIRGLIGGIIVI